MGRVKFLLSGGAGGGGEEAEGRVQELQKPAFFNCPEASKLGLMCMARGRNKGLAVTKMPLRRIQGARRAACPAVRPRKILLTSKSD